MSDDIEAIRRKYHIIYKFIRKAEQIIKTPRQNK